MVTEGLPWGQRLRLAMLLVVWLLAVVRYYPGDWSRTLWATGGHLLAVLPFVVGCSAGLLLLLRRLMGVRFSAANLLRFVLFVGLLVELLYGIHHYVTVVGH